MSIRPCNHPACQDDDGNPYLTSLGMCEPCYTKFTTTYHELYQDYWWIRETLPAAPARDDRTGRASRVRAHPADYAADQSSQIAHMFREAADYILETHNRPTPKRRGNEAARIRAAYKYTEPRLEQLAHDPRITDLAHRMWRKHREIDRNNTRRHTDRPDWPCPYCDAHTLVREPDYVWCEQCNRRWNEDTFGLLARHALTARV